MKCFSLKDEFTVNLFQPISDEIFPSISFATPSQPIKFEMCFTRSFFVLKITHFTPSLLTSPVLKKISA